jgi:hypothetical protein
MKRKRRFCFAIALVALSLSVSGQSWDSVLTPASLDKLSATAWQPSLLTAFGTFTYADSALPSPFSRYLEDGLKSAMTQSSHLKLFNKSVAAAMDPAFRAEYGDFFKNNSVDALLAGRYYIEGSVVRARLELTGLSDGVLIGTLDLKFPRSAIPQEVAVDPSAAASATASSISSLASDSGKGSLKVSVSTERGAGAVYREGEKMVVLVTVNKKAWLKVYHVDATGVVRLIWPNAFTKGRRIDPGSVVSIPGPGDAFAFDMTPPFGTEFIKVIASTRPFSADETAFAELGTDARGAMTRGIKISEVDPAGVGATGVDAAAEKAEAMASYVITKAF